MIRKYILSLIATLFMLPALVSANETIDYTPGVVKQQLAQGKSVLIDYTTDWCSTCAAQKRTLKKVRKLSPAYNKNIVFVTVDWDQYADHSISTDYNIPRRSTLLLLNGKNELGRIVAGTSKSDIQALLDKAIPAS